MHTFSLHWEALQTTHVLLAFNFSGASGERETKASVFFPNLKWTLRLQPRLEEIKYFGTVFSHYPEKNALCFSFHIQNTDEKSLYSQLTEFANFNRLWNIIISEFWVSCSFTLLTLWRSFCWLECIGYYIYATSKNLNLPSLTKFSYNHLDSKSNYKNSKWLCDW